MVNSQHCHTSLNISKISSAFKGAFGSVRFNRHKYWQHFGLKCKIRFGTTSPYVNEDHLAWRQGWPLEYFRRLTVVVKIASRKSPLFTIKTPFMNWINFSTFVTFLNVYSILVFCYKTIACKAIVLSGFSFLSKCFILILLKWLSWVHMLTQKHDFLHSDIDFSVFSKFLISCKNMVIHWFWLFAHLKYHVPTSSF